MLRRQQGETQHNRSNGNAVINQSETSSKQQESFKQYLSKIATERDQRAFELLFDHYAPLIRAYSLAREPGAALLADELTQEVMIRIWEKAHTYNPRLANVNTWVFTLARNCRIDYLRRTGRHISDIDPSDIFAELEDDGPTPFQNAQQQRLEESIRSGLQQLPPEQAEILNKVYMQGKTHQEAGSELKLPLGTVKSRLRLALKKLELWVSN